MIKRNKNKIDISKKRILDIRLNKKTGKKIARTALVLTLGLTMALSNPLNFLGKSKVAVRLQKAAQKAANTKVASAGTNEEDLLKDVKYVSDIKITAGDSRSECIKKLQNAGYKAFDQDLNEHCGGNYIYMGYKTSENREDAITDIRQLHMGVGSDSEKPYGYIDYKTVLSDKRDQFNEASSSLLIALKEYSDNLDAGNKFAKQANKLLNLYTVDDADDEPLGDYLAREDLTVDKLSKILLESNGDVPTTIYTSIFRGIQSDKEDEMWAKLAVKSGSKDYICSTNNTDAFNKSLKLYDGKYLLMAEDLAPKIKEFAKSYNDAVQRIESNNGEINEKDENAATDASIISSKTVLDQFEFPENTFSANADIPTKLGDYIVYVGSNKDSSITLSKTAGYRMLYPLVEAFTQGQIEMLKINSLSSAVGNMLDTEEADQEFEKNYNKALSVLKNDLNVTTISIYANVDNSYLNGKVAVTSAARRQDAAGKTFLKAKERVAKKEKLINDVTTGLRLTMEIVGIASGVVYIASAITAKVVASSAAAAYAAAHGVAATAAAAATAGAEAVAASTACCWLGVATTVFFWVGIALLVALILWSLLSGWIADKAYDPKIERTETLDNIYDMQKIDDESHYIYYEGIKGDDGKTADINDGSGERWSSLFYTKDSRVGSPLCVNNDGDVFSARTNSDVCLFSSPLRHFENKAAENIKQYSKKPKYKMYLHYHTLASLGKEENKGSTSNEKGEYLYDIMEISADSDDDCKNQLLSKGFDYIDENLTPSDTKHTFVGFKTTNNAKNAIRDIRVGSNTQATKLFYGSAGYSGSGATNNENTIYWTKSEDAGTPILAKNFTFSESMKAKDSGWEPVCQLGGGAPFNFNARRDETALSEGRLGVGGALYTNGK
ncbi:MAG: hypothetical protein K6D02_02790, partial [Lachnospiraceae bacterium]|nr:hypothetical protein [Lachnospiraceae bacterium]